LEDGMEDWELGIISLFLLKANNLLGMEDVQHLEGVGHPDKSKFVIPANAGIYKPS